MARLQPLNPGLGELTVGTQPCFTWRTSRPSRCKPMKKSCLTRIQTDRVPSVTSTPERLLTPAEVEFLIQRLRVKLAHVRSAFRAADPDRTGLVSPEEFKRVLKRLLSLSQNQLDTILKEVCERNSVTVDYMQFLRRFSRAPTAHRASNSSSMRFGPQNTSMSLSDIQKHLRDKIGGNLRTVIRAFRLFDYNRGGHIQRYEFRRVLDNYCVPLTEREFQRLWSHYNPNNMTTISYQLFLKKLGYGDGNNIAPICTKLEVSSRTIIPPEKVKQRNKRAEVPSSSCGRASVQDLPPLKLQSLFHEKMRESCTPVWQALQASDITCSGLVQPDVLRAVLSSFLFPMNPQCFQKLISRYGVRAAGPIKWKQFLDHFMSPVEEDNRSLHRDGAFEQPSLEPGDISSLQHVYPGLKEMFHLLAEKGEGWISRTDMQNALERPDGAKLQNPRPCLLPSQITELLGVLDPEDTGVIQLPSLERLNPNTSSDHTGCRSPPSPLTHTTKPLHDKEEEETLAMRCVICLFFSQEEQKTADEKESTQWDDEASLASSSWRTLECLLVDNLSDQLSSALEALKTHDPDGTGYIREEDLKKILHHHGLALSHTHFNKLCCDAYSSSTAGSLCPLVSYDAFLTNLGVQLQNEARPLSSRSQDSSPTGSLLQRSHSSLTHRQSKSSESVRETQPPSSLLDRSDSCGILDIVLKRMKASLERRQTTLEKRILATTYNCDGTLTERDVWKILEDSWILLDDQNFNRFTELLGFKDGQIDRSVFQMKFDEVASRDRRHGCEGHRDETGKLSTAEQSPTAVKTKIKSSQEDNLTAFPAMDSEREGVVNCPSCFYTEAEDLSDLNQGQNLNSAGFVDDGNHIQATQRATVQDQLHELLSSDARDRWADVSKTLCQLDADGQSWIYKKSLRNLLFTYSLPLRPEEFEQLWSKYDTQGRGCVMLADFLDRLGLHHDGELRPLVRQHSDKPAALDAASVKLIECVLQDNYEQLSEALTHLDTQRDGTVKVEELLNLLQTYSCPVQRQDLINHLSRLNVSMDDKCRKLAYMDFLSAFDPEAKKSDRPPSSPDAVRHVESLDDLSPGHAMTRMQELVNASEANLYKAFSAFDQSGTGMIRALEFRRILESFCAHLSDRQYRYMLAKLELNSERGTVGWRDFLFKCKSPNLLVRDGSRSRRYKRCRTGSGSKSSQISEVLQGIQETVSKRLPAITKEMMDLDSSHTGTLSREQFRQLCDCHFMRFTKDQLECVWNYMPLSEQGELLYKVFLKRFGASDRTTQTQAGSLTGSILSSPSEPAEHVSSAISSQPKARSATIQRNKSAPQCTSRRPASVGRPETGSSSGVMESRLRGAMQHYWKEIQRKCSERDPHQTGEIGKSCFLEILHSLNINVTYEDFVHLVGKYDITNGGCISYRDFLGHFLLKLKPPEAKRAFERNKLPLPRSPMKRGVLSKTCVDVMLRLYDAVTSSWTPLRRSFLTSDHGRTGNISVQDFRKVLHHFSVSLSEEEFFHLSSYFDANATGKISYNHFLWAFLQ
ncbi:EF-hand calcium-binding domain-containing protein 6-like [Genypterus blacodes]|uniref:EF-hand calcium-binding domain-containing protein 6-like n=1 Tax=Genypterus blacodes TaxID=154954 RepID=UPI003F760CE5